MAAAALLLAAIVLLAPCIASASATWFTADMYGDTTVVLRFLATDVSAEIRGTATAVLDVSFAGGDVAANPSVRGTLAGEGAGDSYTLAADGWAVFDLVGPSAAGSARLRGALHLSATGISTENPSGQASGGFVAVLEISDLAWVLSGDVSATATGALVPAEIQYTMQVEAGYRLTIDGDATPLAVVPDRAGAESLIPEGWPDDARSAMSRLFESPLEPAPTP